MKSRKRCGFGNTDADVNRRIMTFLPDLTGKSLCIRQGGRRQLSIKRAFLIASRRAHKHPNMPVEKRLIIRAGARTRRMTPTAKESAGTCSAE